MTDTGPEASGDEAEAPAAKELGERRPGAALVFDDPLGRPASDDTDEGWGERPATGGSAADLARFLDEKPPHHI